MALFAAEFVDDWLGDTESDLPFASKGESCVVRRDGARLFVTAVAADATRSGYIREDCVQVGVLVENSNAAPSRSSASPSNRFSIRHSTGETVLGLAIPEVYHTHTEGRGARYMYLITVVTNKRAVAIRRTYREIVAFDAQLRAVCAAAFTPPSLPSSSSSASSRMAVGLSLASTALRASRLHRRMASAETAELRRVAAEQYLRSCLFEQPGGQPPQEEGQADDLLHDTRESIRALLAVFTLGTGSALVVVPAGQPFAGGDALAGGAGGMTAGALPSPAAIAAAVQAVYEAWVAQQGEEGEEEGLPVDEASHSGGTTRSSSTVSVPAVDSLPTSDAALPDLVPMPVLDMGGGTQGEGGDAAQEQFGGLDLDQFDCLMEHGWAVLCAAPAPPSPPAVQEGQAVCTTWRMLVWDGASDTARLAETVLQARWHLGDGRHPCLPWGLSRALLSCGQALTQHTRLTVVLAPTLAHGDKGRPSPLIPPTAHLVYEIRVLEPPSGPAQAMPLRLYQCSSSGPASASGDVAQKALAQRMTVPGQASPVTDRDLVKLAAVAGKGASAASSSSSSDRASARFPGRDTKVTAVPLPSVPAVPTAVLTSPTAPVLHAHGQTLEDMLNPKPKVGTRKLTPEEAQALFASKMAAMAGPAAAAATPKAGGGGKSSPPPGVPHHAAAAAGSSTGGFFSKLWK